MPSQKPRIALTVEPELDAVLQRLSILTGEPKTRIITDFLKEAYPALVGLSDALQDVKDKKTALPRLAKMSALANEQTAIMNGEMAELYQKESQK